MRVMILIFDRPDGGMDITVNEWGAVNGYASQAQELTGWIKEFLQNNTIASQEGDDGRTRDN